MAISGKGSTGATTTIRSKTDGFDGPPAWFGTSLNDVFSGGNADDWAYGLGGNDTLRGNGGNDMLNGGAGHDVILGGDGDDLLYGDDASAKSGNDYVFGDVGDDLIYGGGGFDSLIGGDGNDYITNEGGGLLIGGTGNDRIHSAGGGLLGGSEGNDYITNTGGAELYGGDGDDTLEGGIGNNSLSGDRGLDYVYGGAGDDTLAIYFEDLAKGEQYFGGEGFDTLYFQGNSAATTVIDCGAGTISRMTPDGLLVASFKGIEAVTVIGPGNTVIIGSDYNDVLGFVNTSGSIYGGSGDDFISSGWTGTGGTPYLYGGDGNDLIRMQDGGATRLAYGGDGNDTIEMIGTAQSLQYGGLGDDVLYGGDGYSQLRGGEGADKVYGGSGSAVLTVGAGELDPLDVMDGGDGEDTVFATGLNSVTINLERGVLVDNESGVSVALENIEQGQLSGSLSQSGTIIGTDGYNFMSADVGFGVLNGMGGDDILDLNANQGAAYGGDGDDDIQIENYWQTDADLSILVNGGAGADILEFALGMEAGEVIWEDFSQADGDQLAVANPFFGWSSYDEMIDAGTTITQVGGDTLIQYGDATIRLQGFTGTLGEDDFIF